MTKLASALPQGGNGLDTIAHKLVSKPHDKHVVVGVVDCSKVTTDHDNGSVEPTARVRRIELVDTDDLAIAEQLIRRGLDRRLGASVLPMSIEDDISEAFGTTPAEDFQPDDEGAKADLEDDDDLQPLRDEINAAIELLRENGRFKYGRARRVLQLAREAFDQAEQERRAQPA